MNENRFSYSVLVNSISTVLIGLILLLLPVVFFTNTTEFFILPKQILVTAGAFLLLILYCVKILIEKKAIFVKNPLNLPVFVFAIIIMISAYFSESSLTALPAAVPVIGAVILFFAIINLVTNKQSLQLVISSLIIGSAISAVLNILYSFGIYALPVEETKNQLFNTFGSQVQAIGFLTPLIIYTASVVLNKYRKTGSESFKKASNAFYGAAFALFAVTIGVIFYQIATSDSKPILLPFDHGFQLALAAISQNESRLLPSFLVGSGYGTFSDVFTRFHLPSFNMLQSWSLTFAYSSSFILELIATTGILGFLSFLFIVVRLIRSNKNLAIRPLFLASATAILLSLIIPFSYPLLALLLALLALYIVSLRTNSKIKSVEEVSLSLMSGVSIIDVNSSNTRKNSLALPVLISLISVGFITYVMFFMIHRGENPAKGLYNYVMSDMLFAESLKPEALTDGQKTYDLQIAAIQEYPYRADYYRIFSQINLTLASNLVNSQQGAPTVTEEIQQAILQQLQVAINASGQAVNLSRNSSINWRNLGQVYRNLIGVGENAEQSAITSYNQAISLDPNNPALRIELGGIYYQLQEYDLAQNQFQIAASLKPNYANAYYNLGHALEEKTQLATALQQYQIVAQLVANDPQSLELINAEIEALKARIGSESQETAETPNVEPTADTNLELPNPTPQFPERDPLEQIPTPPVDEPQGN